MNFFRKTLKKIKLFVLYWTRIVFVKNNFKVGFFTKLKANLCGGFLADQYILYDFKHNDKNEYLSEFDWYRSRYINEPFDFAFNNKVICAELLKPHMRVSENLFLKNKGILYNFTDGPKNNEDVFFALKEHGELIIKTYDQRKGLGVHLLEFKNNEILIDTKSVSEDEFYTFLDERDEFVLCEFIQQHEYSDNLFSKTANTIRLITMRDTKTHKMKVFFAVQRVGTSKTIPVDNGSRGGLVCKIDLETGQLSQARCLHDLNVYEVHPDSGKRFEDVFIPRWNEIKEEVLAVAEKISFMDFIAWDLIVTDEGVCVIEANTSSGVNIIQLWGGQRNGELGDFFRHYNVI